MALSEGSELNEPASPKATQKDLNEVKGWMIGVVVVVVALAVTLILQYFAATQATFQDLKDKVVEQNSKIEALTDELGRSQLICTYHQVTTK